MLAKDVFAVHHKYFDYNDDETSLSIKWTLDLKEDIRRKSNYRMFRYSSLDIFTK